MNATTTVSVTTFESLTDGALQKQLWDIYVAAFAGASTQCIQDQLCYTERTFGDALVDPGYMKFVVYADSLVTGFILCTTDLEKARVAYVNPKRFEAMYPVEYAERRICYYTAIAVRPDRQGRRAATMLIQAAGEIMDRESMLVAFDFSTEKNPDLPKLIVGGLVEGQKTLGWGTNRTEYTALGGQTYGIIKLSKD